MKQTDIPIWERYTLTIEEASKYFRIGENKLRRLAEENKNANWLIMNGNRILIKRKQFEKIINSWIKSMSVEEREELIENIYDIVTSSDAKTLEDFDKTKIKSIISMSRTFREMGLRKQTQLIFSLSKILFNSDILLNNNFKSLLSETSDEKLC